MRYIPRMSKFYAAITSLLFTSIVFGYSIELKPELQSPPFDRLSVQGHDGISTVELVKPANGEVDLGRLIYQFKKNRTVLPLQAVVKRTNTLTIDLQRKNVSVGRMTIGAEDMIGNLNDALGVFHLTHRQGRDLHLKMKDYLSFDLLSDSSNSSVQVPTLTLNLEGLDESDSLLLITYASYVLFDYQKEVGGVSPYSVRNYVIGGAVALTTAVAGVAAFRYYSQNSSRSSASGQLPFGGNTPAPSAPLAFEDAILRDSGGSTAQRLARIADLAKMPDRETAHRYISIQGLVRSMMREVSTSALAIDVSDSLAQIGELNTENLDLAGKMSPIVEFMRMNLDEYGENSAEYQEELPNLLSEGLVTQLHGLLEESKKLKLHLVEFQKRMEK